MNRYLMLVGFAFVCPFVNGQIPSSSAGVSVPVPFGSHANSQTLTRGPFVGGEDSISADDEMHSLSTPFMHWTESPSHVRYSHNHQSGIHAGAKTGPLPMSFSLQRAGDDLNCPLKLLHVPYGVWIEIEGAYYQHKSLNNTTDVCVNFEITPSSLQPSVVIRTASSPGEIRQSETSMSRSILLVPGQTVEFDYAREFGEQLRKNPSKSERDRIARMLHAGFDSDGHARKASDSVIAHQTPQADQLSSIQPLFISPNIKLTANANSQWDVAPVSGSLFSLQAGARMLSSLAPNIRLKADISVVGIEDFSRSFLKTQIEGELGGGRLLGTSSDKAEVTCLFNFDQVFNGSSDFAKYVGTAKKSGPIECSFTNVKLEFYNNRFDKESTAAVDGLLISPFTLKLNLTTR